MMSDHVKKIPFFFGHGTSDHVVQYRFGKASYEYLKTTSPKLPDATDDNVVGLTWKEYQGMEHSSSQEEISDLSDWLIRVVPPLTE